MNCVCCDNQVIPATDRQIEAFKLVHIYGLSQKQAAEQMSITQSAVSRLLGRLSLIRPGLISRVKRRKMLSYDESMANDVRCQW